MQIKLFGNVVLYLRGSLLGGFLYYYLSILGAMAYVLFIDGAAGGFGQFVSIPSFILVFGVGIGFTIMRRHTIEKDELGKALKKDFILAGWIGFLVGLGFLGAEMDEQFGNIDWGISVVISSFKTVTIPLLYGYICGKMLEASLTKPAIE
tara:strand:+ start:2251 stop:2700 length:450 start_codon:yes stop_codon:yes gene_type:complete